MYALLTVVRCAAAALLGLITGGLLTAAIHRLPRGDSLFKGRFACPYCRHPLALRDMIPIVSYVHLKRGCRYCAAGISPTYPRAEGLTAALFVLCAVRYAQIPALAAAMALCAALVVCVFVDIEHKMVLDEVLTTSAMFALAMNLFFGALCLWWEMAIGVAVGILPMMVAAKLSRPIIGRRAVTAGHIKFMAMAGAFLGWKGVLVALLFAAMAGCAMAAFGRILDGKKPRLITVLAGGAALALFLAEPLVAWCFSFF